MAFFSCTAQILSYTDYHRSVLEIETLIANDRYELALQGYEKLFKKYDFVFLRDYKIAAQLAAHLGDEYLTFDYLGLGVANGWTLDEIKKLDKIKHLKKNPRWEDLEYNYPSIRLDFEYRINDSVRQIVHSALLEDQKMAFKYLLKPGEKTKDKFIKNQAIPISESHVKLLSNIISSFGYPGEQLIGNHVWSSTMLSHHNSLSPEYQQSDTLYPYLKPKLLQAIERGEMHPYDLAIIDDWYISVKTDHKESSYGIIKELTHDDLEKCNQLRSELNIRSVELRNRLIDIEQKTGMNLYLGHGSWVQGKIRFTD